jgi:hypothetical protein
MCSIGDTRDDDDDDDDDDGDDDDDDRPTHTYTGEHMCGAALV